MRVGITFRSARRYGDLRRHIERSNGGLSEFVIPLMSNDGRLGNRVCVEDRTFGKSITKIVLQAFLCVLDGTCDVPGFERFRRMVSTAAAECVKVITINGKPVVAAWFGTIRSGGFLVDDKSYGDTD